MPFQELKFSSEVRQKIKKGVDLVADAVELTLGPSGRLVTIKAVNFHILTKDGVTVAEAISLEDQYEDVGADIIKEAAKKSNSQSGDGTTVCTSLTRALISAGYSALDSKISPIALIKGAKQANEFVNKFLDKLAKPIKDYDSIKNVASISANDKEMGEHIANLFNKIGAHGVITVEDSKQLGYEEKYIDGISFDKGSISPYMVTDTIKMRAEIEDPYILFANTGIDSYEKIAPILKAIGQKGPKKLVVIADDILEGGE
mgnify:FL=1